MPDEQEKTLKVILEYQTNKASLTGVKAGLKDIESSVENTKGRLKSLTKLLDDDLAKGTSKWAKGLNDVDLVGRKLELLGRQIGGTWGDALGSIGGGIGAIMDSADLLQGLKGLTGLKGGIGGGVGLGALGVAGSVVAGVGAGALGYEGLRSAGVAKGASLGQFASVGAYGVGSLFGQDTAQKWFKSVATALGELPAPAAKATNAIKQVAQAAQSSSNAFLQAAMKMDNSRAVSQQGGQIDFSGYGGVMLGSVSGMKKYAHQKSQQQETQQIEDVQAQRQRIIRAARNEEIRAERDYQRERKQEIAKFNLETKQLERNHQIEMQRMREDTNRRLNGLAIERDEVSYLQEWEAAQTEQRRAEEDYQIQMQNRKNNFNLQLSQEQQDFEAAQSQRRAAARQQLDELKTSLSQENAIKQQGYNTALKAAKDFAGQMNGIFASSGTGGSSNTVNKQIASTFAGAS